MLSEKTPRRISREQASPALWPQIIALPGAAAFRSLLLVDRILGSAVRAETARFILSEPAASEARYFAGQAHNAQNCRRLRAARATS
jgi:hypothetical protein